MDPLAAWIGSRERCPSVGTCHALNAICVSPGISVGAREVFGKMRGQIMRDRVLLLGLPDRSIIVPTNFQPARV